MRLAQGLKRRTREAAPPVLFLAISAYFAWNVVKGEHGLIAYAARQLQLKAGQAELAHAQAEQATWQHRVDALRDRLDPDMLDERARAMLNVADPADLVVLYPPGKKLF
jgi:cell division protein FtsB